MDIAPQDVIDVLVAAGVKNWVLMGLHGYVGYLPSPRATQDVDVLVPHEEHKVSEERFTAHGRTCWCAKFHKSYDSWIRTIAISKANRNRSST